MSAPAPPRSRARPRAFYVLCLGLVLLAQLATESLFPLKRHHAESLDDSLIYVSKSVQLAECPLQDCIAYRDIARQSQAATQDRDLAFARYRAFQGSFLVYHPLFSALLEGLHALGAPYEQGFMWLGVAGALAIVVGAGALLYQALGAAPAGAALLLIAPLIFQLRGMLVPSSIAVGLCMWLWAHIIRRRSASAWLVLFAAPLLLGFHFVVAPLILATAVLYFALSAHEDLGKALWVTACLCALVAAYFVAQRLVDAPLLRPLPVIYPEGVAYLDVVAANFSEAARRVLGLGNHFMTPIAALLVVASGMVFLERPRHKAALVLGLCLSGLLGLALFYPHPNHPGEIFRRFWFPAAVLLTGFFANGLLSLAREGWAFWTNPASSRARRSVLAGVALVLSLWMVADYASSWRQYARETRERLARMDPPFSAGQARRLRVLAPPGGTILVMEWEILFYLYSERFLDRHFVYYPALGDAEPEWLHRRNPIGAGLAWHPFRALDDALLHDGMVVARRHRLVIGHASGRLAGPLQVRAQADEDVQLRIRVKYADGTSGELAPVGLGKGEARWIPLAGEGGKPVAQFEIAHAGRAAFRLQGLRLDPASPRLWPWDLGLWVAEASGEDPPGRRIDFDSKSLFPKACPGVEIVDDTGYLVLARVNCRLRP